MNLMNFLPQEIILQIKNVGEKSHKLEADLKLFGDFKNESFSEISQKVKIVDIKAKSQEGVLIYQSEFFKLEIYEKNH